MALESLTYPEVVLPSLHNGLTLTALRSYNWRLLAEGASVAETFKVRLRERRGRRERSALDDI